MLSGTFLGMKRFIFLALLFLVGCGSAAEPDPEPQSTPEPAEREYPAEATVFTVYRPDSGVRYRITETFLENVSAEVPNREPGEVEAVGNSPGLTGELALDLTTNPPRLLGGYFEADLTLLRTNQERRDERLRGRWLQTYTYPTATFELAEQDILAEPYTPGDDVTFSMVGNLTVRDVTIPVLFLAEATLNPDMTEIVARADASLLISDLGIEPPSLVNIVQVDDPFEIGAVVVARTDS